MAQIKIYGIRDHLDPIKRALSDAIHSCVVDALQFPADKRAHRFFPLDSADFFYPGSASPRYTIIEISMFEGRSVEAKKSLIRLLFERVGSQCGAYLTKSRLRFRRLRSTTGDFGAFPETKWAFRTRLRFSLCERCL